MIPSGMCGWWTARVARSWNSPMTARNWCFACEKGVEGSDHGHFGWPASLSFMPDGSFYVADGYHNARVVQSDSHGKYLREWGSKGSGPGQFNLIHDVAVDAQHRIYVADRA